MDNDDTLLQNTAKMIADWQHFIYNVAGAHPTHRIQLCEVAHDMQQRSYAIFLALGMEDIDARRAAKLPIDADVLEEERRAASVARATANLR